MYEHRVWLIFDPGVERGFVYTSGLACEFFALDVPVHMAKDVAGMMAAISQLGEISVSLRALRALKSGQLWLANERRRSCAEQTRREASREAKGEPPERSVRRKGEQSRSPLRA